MRMTGARARVLLFIIRHLQEHGFAPTYREMMKRFGWRKTNASAGFVERLEKDGFLRRPPAAEGVKARALKVCAWPDGVPYDLTRGRADQLRADLPERVTLAGGAELVRVL